MPILLAVLFLLGLFWYFNHSTTNSKWIKPNEAFPTKWRILLAQNVSFYHILPKEEKERFEYKIQEFLLNHRITGIQTKVTQTDELLVAAVQSFPFSNFQNGDIPIFMKSCFMPILLI
ncbi:MAG: zinc-dependent peptidase [Bacteroidota bacterium]